MSIEKLSSASSMPFNALYLVVYLHEGIKKESLKIVVCVPQN